MSIAAELETIAKSHKGVLHPPTVVQWARKNPKSELHGRFEWDDRKAGSAHRLWQARHLIATVFVEVRADVPEQRLYVSLQSDRGKVGYRDVFHVLAHKDMAHEALAEALREVEYWWVRYCHLAELAGVGAEITRVRERFAKRRLMAAE